jgi:hypothetical protein
LQHWRCWRRPAGASLDEWKAAAAAGAATGATVGLVGGPVGVAAGAVIGGGAGAITGAETNSKQVDLPPPPWKPAGS